MTGELQTYDLIINMLINFWKKHKRTTNSIKTITYTVDKAPKGTIDPRFYRLTS